jgi:hypothetical protein
MGSKFLTQSSLNFYTKLENGVIIFISMKITKNPNFQIDIALCIFVEYIAVEAVVVGH